MDKNKRLAVWLPVIIELSIALGIFVGNHYLRLTQDVYKRQGYNKAPACESRGFGHKKEGENFDTPSFKL